MQFRSIFATNSQSNGRRVLRTLVTALRVATIVLPSLTAVSAEKPTAKANPASQGSWTAPFNVGVVGINTAMLYTGQVLMWSYPVSNSSTTEPAVLFNPVTNGITSVDIPISSSNGLATEFFCSGMNFMPDGKVLVAGGLAGIPPSPDYGITAVEIFDPASSTWTAAAPMNFARWYPTNVSLGNGVTMVLSGINSLATATVAPIEEYNESTNTWALLKTTANLPANVETYPRMFLTTAGKLVMAGQLQTTRQFDNTWSVLGAMQFGNRVLGSFALMPGLNKILAVGGRPSSTLCTHSTYQKCSTASAEIFDLTTNTWTYTGSMANFRQNENLEVLPDGTYLVVGGNQALRYDLPVEAAELYNPSTGQWTTMASQKAPRGYHSTAALLPDGRVLSAGSDSGSSYGYDIEMFSPPYLFAGARPTITSSPASVKYGAQFTISTPDASTIKTVALIRPSATTHAQDWEQRYVTLSFTAGNGIVTATAPPNSNYAPPGYYMIAMVNTAGVPAVMPFIQVTSK
jgi:WD40 repeat protein